MAVSLPGDTKASGLWPAAWTMGNLGRAGYGKSTSITEKKSFLIFINARLGGSLDGNWPYSCVFSPSNPFRLY